MSISGHPPQNTRMYRILQEAQPGQSPQNNRMYRILQEAQPGQVIDALIDDGKELHKVRIEIKDVRGPIEQKGFKYNAYGEGQRCLLSSFKLITCNEFLPLCDTIDVWAYPKRCIRIRINYMSTASGKQVLMYPYNEATMANLFEETDTSLLAEIEEVCKKKREIDAELTKLNDQLTLRNKERRERFLQQ